MIMGEGLVCSVADQQETDQSQWTQAWTGAGCWTLARRGKVAAGAQSKSTWKRSSEQGQCM